MPNVATAIHRELSGENAHATATALTAFHRPPGGAGYHAATSLVAERLRAAGLVHVEESTYPLDGETLGGHDPFPLAWEPYDATVKIVGPVQEPVVDLASTSSCLAWWSTPTPPGGMTAELIDVGTGESDADFAGKELAGKIVLIGHTPRPGGWMHAAREAMQRGAKGILSDYLFYEFTPDRTREGLPEAVQLLRLPNQRGQFDAWACGISYPAAQRLRELLKLGPVTLHADIQCRLFKGQGRNLVATIPGAERPDESVFFVAHCSAATKPCINCAAGPALMVEIARTLHALIERGELRRPRRSIKFLFLIEGLGSRAYFDANPDLPTQVKTAFVLDSVGHDQGKLRSVLVNYKSPDSVPSFVNDYFAGVHGARPEGRHLGLQGRHRHLARPVRAGAVHALERQPLLGGVRHPEPADHVLAGQVLPHPASDRRQRRPAGLPPRRRDDGAGGVRDRRRRPGGGAGDRRRGRGARGPAAGERRAAGGAAGAGGSARRWRRRTTRPVPWRERLGSWPTWRHRLLRRPTRRSGWRGTRCRRVDPERERRAQGRADEPGDHGCDRLRSLVPEMPTVETRTSQRWRDAGCRAAPDVRRTRHCALRAASHPELVALVERMQAQDPTVIFDTLRPICDELWNLIDGERTVGQIAEALVLQFDVDVDPETWCRCSRGWPAPARSSCEEKPLPPDPLPRARGRGSGVMTREP